MGFIYKIINDINDKIYIGQTINSIEYRFRSHINEATNADKQNKFHKALLELGVTHFKIEQIEKCPDEQLNEREQYWIKYYDSVNNGYNTTWGGSCGIHYDRNELLMLWKQGMLIKDISDKINIDRGLLGRILKTIGITQEEINARKNLSQCRSVYQINPYTGKIIKCWSAIGEAATYLRISQDNIVKCCCLVSHAKTAGGYAWRYTEDYNESDDANELIQYSKRQSGKKKIVLQYDSNNNLINTFNSTQEAGTSYSVSPTTIARYCRKERTDPKGFIWEYAK